MKHRDARLQVRVNQDVLDDVEEMVQQRGFSVSALVRAFLWGFRKNPDEALEGLDIESEQTRAEYDHEHAKQRRK